MESTKKLNKKEYEFYASLIWGCVPIDTNWATGTRMYQEKSKELLEKYPNLWKDFDTEWDERRKQLSEQSKFEYEKLLSLDEMLKLLRFNDNNQIRTIAFNIFKECWKQNKTNIIVSRTSENELLIYTSSNENDFKNILIDEDGDVSFLEIGSKTETKFFPSNEINYKAIVELL